MNTQTHFPEPLSDAPEWAKDIYTNLKPLSSYADIESIAGLGKGTMANFCSQGKGPQNGLYLGRKRQFPRLEVILWLLAHTDDKRGSYGRN